MNNRSKIVLSVGFISLAGAVAIAVSHPATGYEASIYHATPNGVWVLLVLGLVSAISQIWSRHLVIRRTAISLLIGSILTVVFLPYIRGYQYLGEYDSLSQLGWTRSLSQGTVGITDLFYPALHYFSYTINLISGIPIERSHLLLSFILASIYVPSVVLLVKHIRGSNNRYLLNIAIVSGLLFLPIVLIRVPVLQPIPATLSILFFPFVLYTYLRSSKYRGWRWQILFLVSILSLLFLHPQQAFNFSTLVITLGIYSSIAARTNRAFVPSYSPTLPQFSFACVVIIGWISTQTAFVRLILHMLTVISSPGALDAEAAGGNGSQPEVNILLILLKVFFVSMLYLMFSTGYVLKSVISAFRSKSFGDRSYLPTREGSILEIILSLIPLVLISILFIASGRTNQIFRYVGLSLVFTTVIGAISIYDIHTWSVKRVNEKNVKKLLQVGLLLVILISIPIIHPSVYVSKPTDHVTDHQLSGYETTFEYTVNGNQITSVYSPVDRYRDAILGRQENRFGIGTVPSDEAILQETPDHFHSSENIESEYYMVITEPDKYYAIHQYQEQQYTRSQFNNIMSNRNISKVFSNGEFDLYLVQEDINHSSDQV